MTKIKICGITGEDEIAALNETGVDYAGFVLYEKANVMSQCRKQANYLKNYIRI